MSSQARIRRWNIRRCEEKRIILTIRVCISSYLIKAKVTQTSSFISKVHEFKMLTLLKSIEEEEEAYIWHETYEKPLCKSEYFKVEKKWSFSAQNKVPALHLDA